MKTIKSQTDTTNVETQQPGDVTFDKEYAPEGVEIEIVPAPSGGGGDKKQFDELKFNEDIVEVMVHESTDPNAENPIFTACNGVSQYFFRGQVQKVKRKYVAILAACKEHSISTPEYTQNDGTRATKIVRTASLKYPFSIISDPAGKKGAEWLSALLRAYT